MDENININGKARGRRVSGWWVALGILALLFVAMIGMQASGGTPNPSWGAPVGVVSLSGAISGSESRSLFGGRSGGTRGFIEDLEEAGADPTIKAVVIRVNSPGGSAAASQEMYQAVRRLRALKPVYCSMGDVAASGGYYVAAGCDQIFANGSTLTGSIGVISQFTNFQDLFRKVGLSETTIKSGKFKDSGSPTRPLRPEEKRLFQTLILDVYNQFVDDVVAGRKAPSNGKMTRAKVLRLADGRVYTGQQAKANGLVDQLGGLYDAVQAAGKAVGIDGVVRSRDIESGGGGLGSLFGATASRSLGDAFAEGALQRLKAEAGKNGAPQLR